MGRESVHRVEDHRHNPAHTKEDGSAAVLELQSEQAKSSGYWQSCIEMNHSVPAKEFGYWSPSTEMDILVGGHRKLAVKLSMIHSSALNVSRLKNLFTFSLA